MLKKGLVLSVAIFLLALSVGTAFAAAAKPPARSTGETVGLVDIAEVTNSHPALANARQQIANIARQKENEAKMAADKETDSAKKAQVVQAKRLELAQEEQRLMEPIIRDCEQAVRTVAKNKNLTLVLNAATVLYGGIDITQDVVQQLAKKK